MLRRTGLEERIGPDGFYLTVVEAANAFDADRPTDGMEP